MNLQLVESLDKEETHLCNICLQMVSVEDGVYLELNSNGHVCKECKEENNF